jgi:hypothetical protein
MTDPALNDDVWRSRDLPVLVAVARRIDQRPDERPDPDDIAADTGLDPEQVRLAGLSLQLTNYVTLQRTMGSGMWFTSVSPRAYEVTGLHPNPDDLKGQFLDLVRQAIDREPDEHRRGLLRTIADAGRDVSAQTLAGILTALVLRP